MFKQIHFKEHMIFFLKEKKIVRRVPVKILQITTFLKLIMKTAPTKRHLELL